VSETSYLSIGEVLQLLQAEFPDVTISKIRFLESQGLIDPERTPSGYRKFYDQDIDRLKFILREQKDSYLPLKVIKHRLDAGESTGPVVRPMMSVDPDGVLEPGHTPNTGNGGGSDPTEPTEPVTSEPVTSEPVTSEPVTSESMTSEPEPTEPATTAGPMAGATAHATTEGPGTSRTSRADPDMSTLPPGSALTFDELASAASLTPAQLREVERYGLLVGRPVGRTTYYDDEAIAIARLAAGFMRYGIEPRHLRMYRNAAEREAGVFEQVILPLVKQRNPAARSHALGALSELSDLGAGLREALVRQALRGYTESL
jgi:DNA-binding transcriptional MerR regulator